MSQKKTAKRATACHYKNKPNDSALTDLFIGNWYIEITSKGFKKVRQ